MEPIEILPVDENTRVVVYYDPYGTPEDFDMTEEEIAALPDPVGVVIERRYKWVKVDMENAETEERYEWEEEDSIWGCFCDEEYTPAVVAKEYFGVEVA